MQKQSRRLTNPNARDVYPIELKGFKRIWGLQGGHYKTTFLTLVRDKQHSLNAVYYPVADYDILKTDQRERGYCRVLASKNDIEPLGLKTLPDGKYWIYTEADNKADLPNQEYPIAQSYIDTFLDGCIQIGNTYHLPGFISECISKTHGWPTETNTWINDRQFPRRPFNIPNAFNIDALLSKKFTNYYNNPIE